MLLMLKSLDTTVGCSTGLLEVCCGKNVSTVCPFCCLCSFSDGEIIVKALAMLMLGTLKGNC